MTQTLAVNEQGVLSVRPVLDFEQVVDIAAKTFGLEVDRNIEPTEFYSFHDRNFLLTGVLQPRTNDFNAKFGSHAQFVLKILNSYETHLKSTYKMIDKVITYCCEQCKVEIKFPEAVPALDCKDTRIILEISLQADCHLRNITIDELEGRDDVKKENGKFLIKHLVSLMVFIPGKDLTALELSDTAYLRMAADFGRTFAVVAETIKDFPISMKDQRQKWVWNVVYASKVFRGPYVTTLVDENIKNMIWNVLDEFDRTTSPELQKLPRHLIHGDPSCFNVILNEYGKVLGLIDFGHVMISYRIVDLSICIMYFTCIAPKEESLKVARAIYQSYNSVSPLSIGETHLLYNLILMRYVQSCCYCTYQFKFVEPDNEYLLRGKKNAWDIFKYFCGLGKEAFLETITTCT